MSNINTLRRRQNGRRFADDIFKRIFLSENVRISIKISLKFVRKGPINNNRAMVHIMAWCRSGDKPYLNQWWLVYWRIYASLGLNESKSMWFHRNTINGFTWANEKMTSVQFKMYLEAVFGQLFDTFDNNNSSFYNIQLCYNQTLVVYQTKTFVDIR